MSQFAAAEMLCMARWDQGENSLLFCLFFGLAVNPKWSSRGSVGVGGRAKHALAEAGGREMTRGRGVTHSLCTTAGASPKDTPGLHLLP